MSDKPDTLFDPEDELRAENEVIKLKLELEHGMQGMEASSLNPMAQNQWLNYIYNFEQLHKISKKITVYESLGEPHYIKIDELSSVQVTTELERIISIMNEKGIALDMEVDYEDTVIYKFITEELFLYEMDDIQMEGMVHHFSYEEFYPNHDHDLRRYTREFIETILEKRWSEKFDTHNLAELILFKEKEYDSAGISTIIKTFQDAHRSFQIKNFEIELVAFDLESKYATVEAKLGYTAQLAKASQIHEGIYKLDFIHEWGYWYISKLTLPGLG
jgi:hypothetical protein